VLVLLENGAKVTLIDNLSNSFPRVFNHMKKLAGDKAGNMAYVEVRSVRRTACCKVIFEACYLTKKTQSFPQCDINNYDLLTSLFKAEK
jgi:UDP-glucose 4-epimerase